MRLERLLDLRGRTDHSWVKSRSLPNPFEYFITKKQMFLLLIFTSLSFFSTEK